MILLKVILYFAFIFGNIKYAEWNNNIRLQRIKIHNTDQINHFRYGGIYFGVCVATLLLGSWIYSVSLLLQHASVFAVAYNEYSEHPSFWLSPTSNAITDTIYRKIKLKTIFYPALISAILSIVLFIYSIIK